jgi:hypothetical protein
VENPIKLIRKLHEEELITPVGVKVPLGDLAKAVPKNEANSLSAEFLDTTSALAIEAITLMMEAGLNPAEVTKVLNVGVQQRLKVCRSGTNCSSKLLRQIAFQEVLNSMR